MHGYPEMNAKIVEPPRISGSPLHLYAAQRIKDLEQEVRHLKRTCSESAGAMKRVRAIVNTDLRRALQEFAARSSGGSPRYVGAFRQGTGDEFRLNDGRSTRGVPPEGWAWLRFIRDPANEHELKELDLGSSEAPAKDWIVFDLQTWNVLAADARKAEVFVRRQWAH